MKQQESQEDQTVSIHINTKILGKNCVKPIQILVGVLGWVKRELPVPAIAPKSPRTGRLAQHVHNWSRIATPMHGGAPQEFHLSQELDHKLAAEIQALLEKGAVSTVYPPMGQGFISKMFVVPKKDGGARPIIDLRELNKFIPGNTSRWKESI